MPAPIAPPPRRRLPDVLETRIGRRLVLYFIATGLLPLALFAWPIHREARAGLSEEVLHGLRGYARLSTEQIGSTLMLARSVLRAAADAPDGAAESAPPPLRRIARLGPDLRPAPGDSRAAARNRWASEIGIPVFAADAAARPRGDATFAFTRQISPGVRTLYLLAPARRGGYLLAEVDPIALWICARPRNLGPADLLLAVDGDGTILASSIDPAGTALAEGRLPFPVPAPGTEGAGEETLRGLGEVAWEYAAVDPAASIVGSRWGVIVARRTDAAAGAPRRLFRSLVLLAAFALAVLILLSMRIARGIHRPVADLIESTKEVAAGDWTARAEVTRKDELGALARSFNEMTEALQRDMRTQLRLEEEAMVGRLASTVAHEVNNPLASIKNRLGLLARRLPPELRPELAPLEGQLNRIARTIRSLLDYSDRRALRADAVDLDVLTTESASLLAPSYLSKGIDLRIEPPGAPLRVQGDAVAIQEVLLHLLEFEREHLASGRTVRVSLRPSPEAAEHARILFTDDGPGLGANPERVFHPSPAASADVSGLGLAVALRLVEALGGTIRAENGSPAEGGGARFVVDLPLCAPPPERGLVLLRGGAR